MSTVASLVFTRFNVLAVLYLAVLWLSASQIFQFQTTMTLEDNFPGDVGSWSVRGDANNALIGPKKIEIVPRSKQRTFLGKTYVLNRQNIEKSYLSIEADLASRILPSVSGEYHEISGNQSSLLYVWFGDSDGERLKMQIVSRLMPYNRTLHPQGIIHVPTAAHTVTVELLLRQYQSQHELVNLDVRQVERSMLYKVILGVMVLIPIAALWLSCRNIQYRVPFIPVLLIAAVAVTLVIGVLMPGEQLLILITTINTIAPQFKLFVQQHSTVSAQDVLHFLGFVLLALVTLTIYEKMRYPKSNIVIKLVLFAVFTEVIQRHSIERSPSMVDIVLDISGLAMGVLIWFSCNLALSRWRHRSELA